MNLMKSTSPEKKKGKPNDICFLSIEPPPTSKIGDSTEKPAKKLKQSFLDQVEFLLLSDFSMML